MLWQGSCCFLGLFSGVGQRVVSRRGGCGGQEQKGMLWFADKCVSAGSAPGGKDLAPSSILFGGFKGPFGYLCLGVLPGEGENKLYP